jgi:alkylation response protein AidB-like acyl-CoA dehydrogenase
MGRIFADLEVQRYAALRVLSALQKGDAPGAASSITKLSYTEFEKRYYELALEILGPFGQLMVAREEFEEVDTSSGSPAPSRPRFSGRARERSTRGRPRSRRTSSESACSACPKKCAPTG